MSKGDPPSTKDDPYDVSQQGSRFHSHPLFSVDHLPAERPEGKGGDPKSGNAPGNSDDRNKGEDSGEGPAYGHEESPKEDPDNISDEAERTVERSDLNGICIGHAVLCFQDQAGTRDLPSSDEIVFHIISSGNDARSFLEGRK